MTFLDPYEHHQTAAKTVPAGAVTVQVGDRLHELATLKQRFAALAIDFASYRLVLLLVLGLWISVRIVSSISGPAGDGAPASVTGLYVALTVLWFGPLTYRGNGQSPGMRLLAIRVVDAGGGQLTLGAVLVRETIWRVPLILLLPLHTLPAPADGLVLAVCAAALATAASSATRQAVYDRLAHTVVVRDDRNWAIGPDS